MPSRPWFVTFPHDDIVRRDCYTTVWAETEQQARQRVAMEYGRDGFREVKASPPYSVERMQKIGFGE